MTAWLHHHLIHDHSRAWQEIAGLSLDAVHGLEHVEQAMGLADLNHWHPVDATTGPRRPPQAAVTYAHSPRWTRMAG